MLPIKKMKNTTVNTFNQLKDGVDIQFHEQQQMLN